MPTYTLPGTVLTLALITLTASTGLFSHEPDNRSTLSSTLTSTLTLTLTSTPLTAFKAEYRLKTDGWPQATITHRLYPQQNDWISRMVLDVPLARGHEQSRFVTEDGQIRTLDYQSGYSVFGMGSDYRLNGDDFTTEHLDRQAAIIALGRDLEHKACRPAAPCELRYLDHEGERQAFRYHIAPPTSIRTPAGDFKTATAVLSDPEKPGRELRLRFHPRIAGLILEATFTKEDGQSTRVSLRRILSPAP